MVTAASPRAVIGVILPSTNTVVEAEYNQMRPPGVSFHASRVYVANDSLGSDSKFADFQQTVRTQLQTALRDILTCQPDYLVTGLSTDFWGGAEGAAAFENWIRESSGLAVTTGAAACRAALETVGARRIAIVSPYQPIGNEQARAFFTEAGFEIATIVSLARDTARGIAQITSEEVRSAFLQANESDADALLQVGTNLAAVDVAAKLDRELGKPVLAINAATVWHALRANGITDQLSGFGRLLQDY